MEFLKMNHSRGICVTAILCSLLACVFEAAAAARRPNVLFIVMDDMNGYGVLDQYPVIRMPHLDQLREQSINFRLAACESPVCTPSRAAFMSGLYPHNTGAYHNGCDPWRGSSRLKTIEALPECFKRSGYITWGGGKVFHARLEAGREKAMFDNSPVYKGGFGPFSDQKHWFGGGRFQSIQPWDGPDTDFPDVKNANAAIEFLGAKHEKPFFMFYGLWRPHSPYTAPRRFFELYEEQQMPLPPGWLAHDLEDVPRSGAALVDQLQNIRRSVKPFSEAYRRFLWGYCANSSFADWNVGRVIEALDASPHASNTLVIFASDNGFHCGEKERWGKGTLWEAADSVPLMIRVPAGPQGACDRTVGLIDLYPTLVDYCRLTPPEHSLDGRSLVPLLQDPAASWTRPSLTTYGVRYASVRDEHWRYLRYPDGSEELYDHRQDAWEWTNVAGHPANWTVMDRLGNAIPGHWAKSLGGRWEVSKPSSERSAPPES